MSKKENDLVKELHEQIVSGKAVVHTKKPQEVEKDVQTLKQKQQADFVGAMVLLTATLYKLEELQGHGATKNKTKMLVNQTIKSMEFDLDKIFDVKAEDNGDGAAIAQEGSAYLEKGLDIFLRQRTRIYEE